MAAGSQPLASHGSQLMPACLCVSIWIVRGPHLRGRALPVRVRDPSYPCSLLSCFRLNSWACCRDPRDYPLRCHFCLHLFRAGCRSWVVARDKRGPWWHLTSVDSVYLSRMAVHAFRALSVGCAVVRVHWISAMMED